MQRNWYVLCTQKKQEKKVSSLLTKKGFENFCPFSIIEMQNVSRHSKAYKPLFDACVFVNVQETDLGTIRKMPGVINTLYWRSSPAIIKADEINAIKTMVESYSFVKLQKTQVKMNENISVVERSITGYNNNIAIVKHKGISVTLPSLGYTLSADREKIKAAPQEMKKVSSSTFAERLSALLFFGF